MLRNAEGDIITPSVVLFDDSEVIVGKEARRLAHLYPDRVAEWVKRDMGQPVYSRPIRGERLPPEVIQACILRKLKADILATVGPTAKAVITVPAYFDELRRKATADAGEMAGLSLLDIVNEPTAAALGFGEALGYLSPLGKPLGEMVVMVYDLGGGTFDATLLRLAPGDIRTLATDGDVQLGGHDWDTRLVDHAAEVFRQAHGRDPRDDPAALSRLYAAAVEAKHTLSARTRATIRVEHAGSTCEVPVTREAFEEMTADLVERTAYTTRQLLAAAGLQWSDVSRLLLVGGATRMPMVSRMLHELTGLTPDRTVNPDEAVARGAAIYANYLLAVREGGPAGAKFKVTNVNSHSLGVEGIDPQTYRKINVVLIPRNTPLPAKAAEKFMTKTEGQRSIVIQVLEGESTLPGECMAIGRTVIRDLPAGLPKGWPVEVSFEYGENGRLTVRGQVPGTHREVVLDLERDVGLSNEGISRWKQAVASTAGFDAFESMIQEVLPVPA
jgi:molecular chaperone DnaK